VSVVSLPYWCANAGDANNKTIAANFLIVFPLLLGGGINVGYFPFGINANASGMKGISEIGQVLSEKKGCPLKCGRRPIPPVRAWQSLPLAFFSL
jgi:hypothetical protein